MESWTLTDFDPTLQDEKFGPQNVQHSYLCTSCTSNCRRTFFLQVPATDHDNIQINLRSFNSIPKVILFNPYSFNSIFRFIQFNFCILDSISVLVQFNFCIRSIQILYSFNLISVSIQFNCFIHSIQLLYSFNLIAIFIRSNFHIHSFQSVYIHSIFALIYSILGSGSRGKFERELGLIVKMAEEMHKDAGFNL